MRNRVRGQRGRGNNNNLRISPWYYQQPANNDQFFLYQNNFRYQNRVHKSHRKHVHHVSFPENFIIDGIVYKSIDQFYQIKKVKDLLGLDCEKFTDGSSDNYSILARDLLRNSSVNSSAIDRWRINTGVFVIQKALLYKLRQSNKLKEELIKTGTKLIAHSYSGDDFFGTGAPIKFVSDWCKNLEDKNFPLMFPLTQETLKNVPTIGKGRNVLGCIYMLNRNELSSLQIEDLSLESSQDLLNLTNGINQTTFKSFATTSKTIPGSDVTMNIDFTSDI